MKHVLILMCILFLLTGCAQSPTGISDGSQSLEPAVVPTAAATPVYSQEQAMIEGFLVMQQGDVRHNQQNWFAFLEKTLSGEQAQLNVIHFFDNGSGWGQTLYELSFDGSNYVVCYQNDGVSLTDTASALTEESGMLDDEAEPYDAYQRYRLNDLVLYEDLIIIPAFDAGKPISLHAKEGDPALREYIAADEISPIVSLLSGAEYLLCEPEDHLYGMKLLTADAGGDGIVIELDLRYGNYRYGTQVFHYGEVTDLFAALGIEQWPDSVLTEFKDFLN